MALLLSCAALLASCPLVLEPVNHELAQAVIGVGRIEGAPRNLLPGLDGPFVGKYPKPQLRSEAGRV